MRLTKDRSGAVFKLQMDNNSEDSNNPVGWRGTATATFAVGALSPFVLGSMSELVVFADFGGSPEGNISGESGITATVVPEPATYATVTGLTLVCLALIRRRNLRKAQAK